MKLQTQLFNAIRLPMKKNSRLQVEHVYALESIGGLGGLIVLWYVINPLVAVLYYILMTRTLQQYLYRRFVKGSMYAFRSIMNAMSSSLVILLGLLYGLQYVEAIVRAIRPAAELDDQLVIATVATMVVLASTGLIGVVMYVRRRLKEQSPSPLISERVFETVGELIQPLRTLASRLINSFSQVSTLSYRQLNRKEKWYIWLRVMVFPLGILAPYFFGRLEWTACLPEGCVGSSGGQALQTTLILAFMALIIIVSLLRDRPDNRRALSRFVSWQVATSLLSFLITIVVYEVMYPFSQSAGHERVFVTGGKVVLDHPALFGLGLQYGMVLFLGLFYLGLPLVRWYRVLLSQKYIDGMKKQELFK